MSQASIRSLGAEIIMTRHCSSGCDGKQKRSNRACRIRSAWRWSCARARLAGQRNCIAVPVEGKNVAIEYGLLTGEDWAANCASVGIGNGEGKIGRQDDVHHALHLGLVRSAEVVKRSGSVERVRKRTTGHDRRIPETVRCTTAGAARTGGAGMAAAEPVPLHCITHKDGGNRGVAGATGNILEYDSSSHIDVLDGRVGGGCRHTYNCRSEKQLS